MTQSLKHIPLILILLILAACGSESNDGAAAPEGDVQTAEITVDATGYNPSEVELEAGVPARLTFTRTGESNCIEQIRIPEYGVEKTDLPLNEPVTVTFTPEEEGSYTFVCGMDMMRGTIVVKS